MNISGRRRRHLRKLERRRKQKATNLRKQAARAQGSNRNVAPRPA
jgi:hypothetical protein